MCCVLKNTDFKHFDIHAYLSSLETLLFIEYLSFETNRALSTTCSLLVVDILQGDVDSCLECRGVGGDIQLYRKRKLSIGGVRGLWNSSYARDVFYLVE